MLELLFGLPERTDGWHRRIARAHALTRAPTEPVGCDSHVYRRFRCEAISLVETFVALSAAARARFPAVTHPTSFPTTDERNNAARPVPGMGLLRTARVLWGRHV